MEIYHTREDVEEILPSLNLESLTPMATIEERFLCFEQLKQDNQLTSTTDSLAEFQESGNEKEVDLVPPNGPSDEEIVSFFIVYPTLSNVN